MTIMEIDENEDVLNQQKDQIIDFLTDNNDINFKSQQRGEEDLTKQEKTIIALDLLKKSKLNFLLKFGKYLELDHLKNFEKLSKDCDDMYEINLVLKDLIGILKSQKIVKNRRYEALKKMIEENHYFTEIEMMKRNPLLYEQLIGQYLSEEEKKERDRIEMTEESTLVKILLEGIERRDAIEKQEEQKNVEEQEDEESESEESEDLISNNSSQDYWGESYEKPVGGGQWGEFHKESKESILDKPGTSSEKPKKIKKKKTHLPVSITADERQLLKEEFITTMYQNFLDGKDEDFDYKKVDYNENYDCNDIMDHDQEDKYFDEEEAEIIDDKNVPSEDELDIYMNALNQSPAVMQLSKTLNKM